MNGILQTIIFKINQFWLRLTINKINKIMGNNDNKKPHNYNEKSRGLEKDLEKEIEEQFEKEEKINLSSEDQKKLMDSYIKNLELMEKVKNGFGYSGQAHPNCIELIKVIAESKAMLDEIK